jgi:hypothetical protein
MVTLSRRPGPRIARTIGAIATGRYGKHVKTVGDRWMKKGVTVVPGAPPIKFPPPDLIFNGVRHWYDETVDAFDAEVKAALAAANQKSES